MTDLTVTPYGVRPLADALVRRFTAGTDVDAGDVVIVGSDGEIEPASADSAANAMARGIVLADAYGGTSFVSGQRLDVLLAGPCFGFSGLVPGSTAWVSATAGKLSDAAPAELGEFVQPVGWAAEDDVLVFVPSLAAPTENT